jgi:hypothetical protein
MTVRGKIAHRPVSREAYLVSRKQGWNTALSFLRFTLHEIRFTKTRSLQRRRIVAEVHMNNSGDQSLATESMQIRESLGEWSCQ